MLSFPHLRTETLRDARGFVLHWDKIQALRKDLGVEDDVMLDPLHFLTTTDYRRRSCSVACWHGASLIGLTYAIEHCMRGIGIGYAVGGDYAGRGSLLCRPECETAVIEASIREMVARKIHSLHLRMTPSTNARVTIPGMRVQCLDAMIPGDRMRLPESFRIFSLRWGGRLDGTFAISPGKFGGRGFSSSVL